MAFQVRLSRDAAAYVKRLPSDQRRRVIARIDEIAADPMTLRHSKPLQGGHGLRSARVGGLRIIFVVDTGELLVQIVKIAPRGQAYRNL